MTTAHTNLQDDDLSINEKKLMIMDKQNEQIKNYEILNDKNVIENNHNNNNNNNNSTISEKRRKFSRDRTVSEDIEIFLNQTSSSSSTSVNNFHHLNNNNCNNFDNNNNNKKELKTINNKPFNVSLPSLNTSSATKSVTFDLITKTIKFNKNELMNNNNNNQKNIDCIASTTTKPLISILKSNNNTNNKSIIDSGNQCIKQIIDSQKFNENKQNFIMKNFNPTTTTTTTITTSHINGDDDLKNEKSNKSIDSSNDDHSILFLMNNNIINNNNNVIIGNNRYGNQYISNDNNNNNNNLNSKQTTSPPLSYCNCCCSLNEIQPITYQICLNCHKPLICSSLINSDKSDNEKNFYQSSNNNNNKSIIYTPTAIINDAIISSLDLNESSTITEDSLYQNSTSYLMMSKDDDDFDEFDDYCYENDRPQFCQKCNLWYGTFDPSYPSTCHCPEVIKLNAINLHDSGSIYSVHMRKDFRYYFQHPYSRLFIAYTVIFCNFLIFAEDPLSHSLMECSIPVLGNVISLLFTKYPKELHWKIIKAIFSLSAIIIGLFIGKFFLHHLILRKIFRLKMFREESGTWMIMLISSVISCYFVSQIYNTILIMFHSDYYYYLITSKMGITYALFMKFAACGTWCGDFFTAWMITDMMLQDNLYPNWAVNLREFWHKHANIRIVVFWSGSLFIAATVITIILTELICWDCIANGVFSTTEFSRAFLASFILVMDLLIVMQDWDFPHFVCDLNIKLPGLLEPSYTLNFFRKSLKFPSIEIKITGKWFNYGIIVFVMMLDLNMWKNQVIYYPTTYGQYVDVNTKRVCSITDQKSIDLLQLNDHINGNVVEWTYKNRSKLINPQTNGTLLDEDLMIYARYYGYPWIYKMTSLIPILAGFIFFLFLVYFYGRFPPKTDISLGGRLPKRKSFRSSWHRERRDNNRCKKRRKHYIRKKHISWPGITTVFDNDDTRNCYDLTKNHHHHHNNNDTTIVTKKISTPISTSQQQQQDNLNNEKLKNDNDNNENENTANLYNHLINILKPNNFILSTINTMKIITLIIPIINCSTKIVDNQNNRNNVDLTSISIYDMSSTSSSSSIKC